MDVTKDVTKSTEVDKISIGTSGPNGGIGASFLPKSHEIDLKAALCPDGKNGISANMGLGKDGLTGVGIDKILPQGSMGASLLPQREELQLRAALNLDPTTQVGGAALFGPNLVPNGGQIGIGKSFDNSFVSGGSLSTVAGFNKKSGLSFGFSFGGGFM